MAEARIVIRLAVGEDDGIWVTSVPVRRSYANRPHDVVRAVGEAAGMFIENVIHDRDSVNEKLTELEARDA